MPHPVEKVPRWGVQERLSHKQYAGRSSEGAVPVVVKLGPTSSVFVGPASSSLTLPDALVTAGIGRGAEDLLPGTNLAGEPGVPGVHRLDEPRRVVHELPLGISGLVVCLSFE